MERIPLGFGQRNPSAAEACGADSARVLAAEPVGKHTCGADSARVLAAEPAEAARLISKVLQRKPLHPLLKMITEMTGMELNIAVWVLNFATTFQCLSGGSFLRVGIRLYIVYCHSL